MFYRLYMLIQHHLPAVPFIQSTNFHRTGHKTNKYLSSYSYQCSISQIFICFSFSIVVCRLSVIHKIYYSYLVAIVLLPVSTSEHVSWCIFSKLKFCPLYNCSYLAPLCARYASWNILAGQWRHL